MNITELITILEQHELWLENDGGKRANLQYADLQGANLRGANLRGADLQGANLRGANKSAECTHEREVKDGKDN